MGNPITEGRMIRRRISDSNDFASLSAEAAVLFCIIIPHLNSHGKLQGGPAFIKEITCPKIKYLTLENIPVLMEEISSKTDMKWFVFDGRHWIHAIHFTEHQKLNPNKIGQDLLPTYSDLSPELVTHEAKAKVKVKEEAKAKEETDADASPFKNYNSDAVSDDNQDADLEKQQSDFMDNLKDIMDDVSKKYPREQQQVLVFIQANIRNKHPGAILHCIRSLLKAPDKVRNVPAYLNAALKIENGKYNAADSERKCNAFKTASLTEMFNAIGGK